MPKLKTHKAVSRRIKKTKNKKFIRRGAGQSHFNSRETGKQKRNKRADFAINKTEHAALTQLMPY